MSILKNSFFLSTFFLLTIFCNLNAQTLFTNEERKALGQTFSTYIENMVDTLSLQTDEKASRLSSLKHFYIFIDGKEPVSLRSAAKQLLQLRATKKYKLYMSKNDKLMSCRWAFDGSRSIKVQAEISREAIEGTDKEQADQQLFLTLKSLPKASFTKPIPQLKELKHVANTSLLQDGGKNFMLANVNNCTYYNSVEGKPTPAFNKQFPVETLHNIALNALENIRYRLNISQKIYSTVAETQVALKDLIAYWQQQNTYNIYCGVSRPKGNENYEVIIIAEHKELQYIHLLKFSFSEALFDKPDAVIKASLTPNIPQHNLKSLY